MKHHITTGIFFCSALFSQSGIAQSAAAKDGLTVPDVPAALAVQTGQKLTLIANAKGVQIYTCGPDKNDPNHIAWQFKAPEADLFNAQGTAIGKHYAGPSWESNDGSKVVGQVKASEKAPDASAVAWLLLGVKANQGNGIFAHTSAIQRLNTVGGTPPTGGCDQSHPGKEVRVSYTAQYYFYD
jgi:Protein of unknown function (DUF3455)